MNYDFRKLSGEVANAAAFVGTLLTIAGIAGRYHYLAEVVTHLQPWLGLCFAVYIGIKLLLHQAKSAAAALIPLLINLYPLMMLHLPQPRQVWPAQPVQITILQANVLTSNSDSAKLLNLVRKVKPDIIVLHETGKRWLRDLRSLRHSYPVYAENPREDNFGAAIYCRTTNATATVEHMNDPGMLPLSKVELTIAGKTLTIYGVHLLAPIIQDFWHQRNISTLDLARRTAILQNPVIVTGDFNNTPWSYHYRAFIRHSALLDSSQGRGVITTWPVDTLIKLPLDHCFHSKDVIITGRRRGPDIGSDHYPLIIKAVY
jgi:endonuclease/exonuclease/phosphatase (EEP) superfamily protein YafD